jgi:hypothetical protein
MTAGVVIGLDIGTTTSKALVRRLERPGSLVVQRPTRWQAGPDGRTEMAAPA